MHTEKKKKWQKWASGGVLVVIAIATIILLTSEQKKVYTFEEGFYQLQEIDRKFNTSYHREELNETMPPIETIPVILEEIKKFESMLDKKSPSLDMKALFIFSDIRKVMLTSEWYFQKGKEIGNKGLVNDAEGFSCREAPEIIDATFYFNESFIYATQAQSEIDDVLYMYKYHPDVWRLMGIDQNRTRFFRSDLKHIRHTVLNNMKSVDVHCNIRGIKHQTTLTKPFEYTRELVPKEVFEKEK